jgi:hypothetical protein
MRAFAEAGLVHLITTVVVFEVDVKVVAGRRGNVR